MNRSRLAAILAMSLVAAPALAWYEPARGSAERSDLMNAIRPVAEASLGAPVQFVIDELRVSGDRAYASLSPQRPGGAPITCASTPDPAMCDDPEWYPGMIAFFTRAGGVWGVDGYSISATDVWWWGSEICRSHSEVVPHPC